MEKSPQQGTLATYPGCLPSTPHVDACVVYFIASRLGTLLMEKHTPASHQALVIQSFGKELCTWEADDTGRGIGEGDYIIFDCPLHTRGMLVAGCTIRQ